MRGWPKVHQRAFCFSSRSPHGPSLRMLHEPLPGARIWNVSTDKWTPRSSQTSGFCSFSFRLHSFIRSHTGCKLKLHCKNGILGNESQFEIALLSFLWNRKKQREWAGEYPSDAGVLFFVFFKSVFLLFQTNLVEGLFLHFFCLLFYVACLLHKVSGFMFSFKSQHLNHSMAFLW